VGAGPVGLTTALLLAERGVEHLVVDRRPGPHRAPQAHVVNPRSLEIFRQLGLDTGRLRSLATPREDGGHVAWCTTLAGELLGRLPYERQDDDVLAVTPEPIINLPQHVLEPELLAHTGRRSAPTVRWRHEWRSLTQDADGVSSRVLDRARGDEYELRSRWLIAADGAGSPVRKALGVPMVGPDRLQSFLMIHFEANLRALVRDRPAILYWIMDPACLGSFIAHDIDRTWVFMHPFDPETDPASTDPMRSEAIVRRALGRDDLPIVIRDVSPWHMTSQVAATYRAGRVFLTGDSAHRFPPAGGMGMNTGIQDAHNLVWKLHLIEDDVARPALLDTYEVERRPIAQRNADQSLANALRMLEMMVELGLTGETELSQTSLGALVASSDGRARIRRAIETQRDHFDMLGLQLGFSYDAGALVPDGSAGPRPATSVRDFVPTARPGARVPHAWVDRDATRCSSLDLIRGDAFTLVVAAGGEAWANVKQEAGTVPLRTLVAGRDFTDPEGVWLRTCGLGDRGALLVRPDQHVAWRAADASPGMASLRSALHAVAG
jgi:2,4-dichlorophenol 6-monooxygenase